MEPVALLLFNRNESAGVLATVHDVGRSFAEIVVVDSSSAGPRRSLETGLAGTGARIVPAPPLGCTEPLRPLAHASVRSPWVLSVDADERLSPGLREALPTLPATPSAYRVPRMERALGTLSEHLRLYRPDRVRYEGWIHETPRVDGPIVPLPPDRRLVHEADYARYLDKEGRAGAYLLIESYERPFTGRSLRREFPRGLLAAIAGDAVRPLAGVRRAAFFAAFRSFRWWSARAADPTLARLGTYHGDYFDARRRHFYGLSPDGRREAAAIGEAVRRAGGPTPFIGFDDLERVGRLAATVPVDLVGGNVMLALLRHRYRTGRPLDAWPPPSAG
jgi:hypothetical protein